MLKSETQEIKRPVKLKLSSRATLSDPPRAFSKLREHGIVFPAKLPFMGTVSFVTTWEAVSQVLRNTDDFVREPANAGRKTYSWLQWLMPATINRLSKNMLAKDGDDHRRLRTLVDQAFQRQSVAQMSGSIEELTNRELDKIQLEFQSGSNSVDFVSKFCRPIPLAVICELLGLPARDREKFTKWFAGMSEVNSAIHIFRMFPMMRKTMKYLEDQFDQVRKKPRAGLISSLVQAEADGDRLSKDELLSTAMILLLAGHETTVHLISNSLLSLMQFPESKRRLLQDWSLCDSTIDEVLRWCSVVQMTKPRFVARDIQFHGSELQQGKMVVPLLGCANIDPAEFDRPLEFLIDRVPNRHMTFGNGPHVCIGMKLAKAETNIALQQLFTRWPDLRPDFDLQKPDFGKRLGMRTLRTLTLRRQ